MKINYKDKSTEELFTDFLDVAFSKRLLIKKIGAEKAKAIKKRCVDLLQSANFLYYLNNGLGKPHMLTGDMKTQCGVSLTGNYRLIIEPESESLTDEAFAKCESVIIIGIVDYHGGKNEWLIP